jgi:hypothetical protein
MTTEIGIAITAQNSEPGRIERLLNVLAIVHSILNRNVMDSTDEDPQAGTYGSFAEALASLQDYDRELLVGWRRKPTQRWRDAFKIAWDANCEPSKFDRVVHKLLPEHTPC